MNGIVLGMAMLAASNAGVPAAEMPRVAPSAFTFNLPDAAASSPEQSRPVWQSPSFAPTQGTTTKRFSTTHRIIAASAGASIGFLVGARVGYAVTPKRGPYDDTSGLKGVMIGAPIGAVLGAVLGWHVMK